MIGLRYIVLPLLLCAMAASAVIETYQFSSPELEKRYRELSAELRCPKCQNQNIADSNAPISQDLRKVLYQQLEEGASDQEILEHMVARYGEFVRYRPGFSGATAVLWLAPGLLLLAGISIVFMILRDRQGRDVAAAPTALSEHEQNQLDTLLEQVSEADSPAEDNTERKS
jgi:cytochrome c-type biogenesis protein CcmH